jgi:hypothetical protein
VPESALLVLYAALEKETAMGGAKIQTKSLKCLRFPKTEVEIQILLYFNDE